MVITSDCLYAKEDFESAVKVKLDIVDNFLIENGILETKLFVNVSIVKYLEIKINL